MSAVTCAVTSPVGFIGAPQAEADRQALIAAAQAEGTRLNPAEVLQIARTHVVARLLAWDKLYLDHLNWDDPPSTRWPSQAARDHYVEEGRVAARCLRKHLPDDVAIEYLADGILASEHYGRKRKNAPVVVSGCGTPRNRWTPTEKRAPAAAFFGFGWPGTATSYQPPRPPVMTTRWP